MGLRGAPIIMDLSLGCRGSSTAPREPQGHVPRGSWSSGQQKGSAAWPSLPLHISSAPLSSMGIGARLLCHAHHYAQDSYALFSMSVSLSPPAHSTHPLRLLRDPLRGHINVHTFSTEGFTVPIHLVTIVSVILSVPRCALCFVVRPVLYIFTVNILSYFSSVDHLLFQHLFFECLLCRRLLGTQ